MKNPNPPGPLVYPTALHRPPSMSVKVYRVWLVHHLLNSQLATPPLQSQHSSSDAVLTLRLQVYKKTPTLGPKVCKCDLFLGYLEPQGSTRLAAAAVASSTNASSSGSGAA